VAIEVGSLHSFTPRHRGGGHTDDALALRNLGVALADVVKEVPVGLVKDEQIVHGQLICNRLCANHRFDLDAVEQEIQALVDFPVGVVEDL
jgi:hypothetical protein